MTVALWILAGLAVVTPILLFITAPRIPQSQSDPSDPADKHLTESIENWRNGK